VVEDGSFSNPYKTTTNGVAHVPVGDDILFKGPRSSAETVRITKGSRLHGVGGTVIIGK